MESIVQILGILTVLSVARMQGDRLQVKAAVKIDGSHDVPLEYSISVTNQTQTQAQIQAY